MTPEELSNAIVSALSQLDPAPADTATLAQKIRVERPKNRDHGDWSTNLAMQLAKSLGRTPREVATEFATAIQGITGVASAEVAGPGFINIRLEAGAAGALVGEILQAGQSFGTNQSMSGQYVNLEYVSANPTGPVHLGGARWAAVGDALSRILVANGAKVTREYYFNDHG